MQTIVTTLIAQLGKNAAETHINMAIALRQFGPLAIVSYLSHNLGSLLDDEQIAQFLTSILNLDAAIVSVNL